MAKKVCFVSLGDSIATGTLTPFSRTCSYVFYLQRKLNGKGICSNVYHLAHGGDNSQDLLWKLQHLPAFRTIIQKANFITVSIGGNDLLRAASIPGFTSINVPMANAGVNNFMGNWPQIIDRIRSINPAAEIIVLNLYNPYNDIGPDWNLCKLTDNLLLQMNHAIAAHAENRYRIADTYSTFKQFSKGNMHRVSCLYPYSFFRNPHPTPEGHQYIADLVFRQLSCVKGTDNFGLNYPDF